MSQGTTLVVPISRLFLNLGRLLADPTEVSANYESLVGSRRVLTTGCSVVFRAIGIYITGG